MMMTALNCMERAKRGRRRSEKWNEWVILDSVFVSCPPIPLSHFLSGIFISQIIQTIASLLLYRCFPETHIGFYTRKYRVASRVSADRIHRHGIGKSC